MTVMTKGIIGALLISLILGTGFIYSGLYPMGADDQHNKLTYWALETMRENSVARASKDIDVPALDKPSLLLAGGADYKDMCSGCHLQPGVSENDMTIGLYPSPPNLANKLDERGHDHGDQMTKEEAARRSFWIIKHGIKASGMPAWGPTHDDARIWAMVSFLQKLPELNEIQYQILTARSEEDQNEHH
ncbi:MAG: mono/diheme cytochrome c family protein [Cryomorphaceae bacterium]|jgi:mono/diheme cytochrome c family protein